LVSVSFGCGQCSHNFCYLVIGLQSLFLISVFIDQMVFVERLSSGHELLSKRTAELLSTLSADPRVHGAIPQTVAERREWAAALSWLDTKKPLLADLQALSATDIGTLGSIFELGPGKKPQQLCLLVHAFISDNDGDASQDASFGDMLERHDSVLHGQIARWGLPKLQSAMKNAPSAFTRNATTAADLRERYAFYLWASLTGTPEDYNKLSPGLRQWAYDVLGVPPTDPEVQAGIAALMTGKKLIAQARDNDDDMEVDDGASPDRRQPDPRGSAARSRRGRDEADNDGPRRDSGTGGTRRGTPGPGGDGGTSTRPASDGGTTPARRGGRSNREADGGAAAGSGSDDDVAVTSGGSLWDLPLPDHTELSRREHAALQDTRRKTLSLRISVSVLTSKDELKAIRDTLKLVGDPHEVNVLKRLFSPWPWNQTLAVSNMHSFRPARLGRMAMNSLRTITEQYADWSELQQRSYREIALDTLTTQIDSAVSSGDKASLLLAYSEVRDYAQRVLTAEVASAERNAEQFPFPEFQEILQGRRQQLMTCPRFFDDFSRRVKQEAKRRAGDEEDAWIIGAHISFFQHFKAGDASVEDADELVRLGERFRNLSTSGGVSGASVGGTGRLGAAPKTPPTSSRPPSRAGAAATGSGGTPPGGRGGQGGRQPRSRSAPPAGAAQSGSRYVLGVTLPSSDTIIGPHLGVAGPAFACHHCQEEGHWKGECPVYWASIDSPLPGWRKDGKKDRKAWDGANPKQETFKQWLKFIKTHFEGKGQPARVDGAPSFDDYKDRAANGAGP